MQSHTIQLILQYKYFFILPATLIEGPFVMMVSGFLIKLGYLDFVPAYFLLMAGDLMGDALWYGIGYHWGEGFIRRFGKYVSITDAGVAALKRLFHRYQDWILLISKITMGFGFALGTLMIAGLVKIPFRRYLLLNFFGQFVWTGFLVGVGFVLGNAYLQVDNVLGKLFVVMLLIIAFLALVGFGKYLRTRMLKTNP